MTFSNLITGTSGNGSQFSSRNGVNVDRIILHHCASTSLSGVLSMMSSGSRQVSSNYVIGNGGEIIGVVPEEYRAWTSGSTSWDGRAITFEIVNETAGPEWRVSAKAMDAVSRMLADISTRYGIVLSRATVITHQELYNIYGASYPTACPGPYLQTRVDQVIAAASKSGVAPIRRRNKVSLFHVIKGGKVTFALAGESPGTSANWLETQDQNFANKLASQHGNSAELSEASWLEWKTWYLEPVQTVGAK